MLDILVHGTYLLFIFSLYRNDQKNSIYTRKVKFWKLHTYRYRAVPNNISIANLTELGNALLASLPPVYGVGVVDGVGEELLVVFNDATIAPCRVTIG